MSSRDRPRPMADLQPPDPAPPDPGARRARRLLAAVVIVVIWGLITHGTFAGSGDEPHYQMVAHSIVFDGDFDLANNYADRDNLVFDGGLQPGPHAAPGKDGTLRPVHDVGLPILSAPYFLFAYRTAEWAGTAVPARWLQRAKLTEALILRHLLSLGMAVVAAWIALQLFDLLRRHGTDGAAARWAALVVLSPPLLSHAFLFYTEIVSAAFVLFALRWLLAPGASIGTAALAGALTGGLFLVHARNVGLVAALIAIALWRLRLIPRRALVAFALGIAAPLALRTVITLQFWGTWLFTPHVRTAPAGGAMATLAEIGTRAAGLVVDQEHGLIWYAPIYLLLPVGVVMLWKRERALAGALLFAVAMYLAPILIPALNPHGWRGGWSPAARFLVPIAPLLAPFLFAAATDATRLRRVVMTLVVIQVALDALLWQEPKLLWNDGDGVSALLAYLDGGRGWLTGVLPAIGAR